MKKLIFSVLGMLLMTACLVFARADTARDITGKCTFRISFRETQLSYLTDRNYTTVFQTDQVFDPELYITTSKEAAGVYVEFGRNRLPFLVQVKQDGKWVTVGSSGAYYAQEYVAFPSFKGEIRLKFMTNGYAEVLQISELTVLGKGDIDEEKIHVWRDTVDKADLMIAVAHPDDELLWMGGMIPCYTKEKNYDVLVLYLTCGKSWRELELLNGLWHCGIRNYPLIADFDDFKTVSTDAVYEKWNRTLLHSYLVRAIRRYRPEVVVTHDFKGEYGHAQHVACAYSMQRAVEYAADKERYTKSAREYGLWNVKKFYVHLGDAPTTEMDWFQPLDCFQGKTSFEIASEAYAMHLSQMDGETVYAVADRGTAYDSTQYTLVRSLVGRDKKKNDLFENIRPEDLTTHYFQFE